MGENTVQDKPRTQQQNRALHKYFRALATDLNNAGWDMRRTLKEGVSIPWNEDMVKEQLWKPIMRAMQEHISTTEMTTEDVDTVYQVLSRHLAQKTGVVTAFPSREE